MSAQEAERKRISRELHDELGQALTAMRINLASLENELLPALAPASGEKLTETGRAVDEMLDYVHELSLAFRPTMLDELGLVPLTLRWYVDRYARRVGIEVEFEAGQPRRSAATGIRDGAVPPSCRRRSPISPGMLRHVACACTWARRGSKVTASIQDDGVGFDVQQRCPSSRPVRGRGWSGCASGSPCWEALSASGPPLAGHAIVRGTACLPRRTAGGART